jgi:hypothetical protein
LRFEKVLENHCGSVSAIPVLEISRYIISTCHCNQEGNNRPIWQCANIPVDSLNGGFYSALILIFKEL